MTAWRHGMKHSKAYRAWRNMRYRCENPSAHNFADYGGRGITVCAQWSDFLVFLADMGQPKAGQSIDRKDNSLGYTPDNCRWADAITQSRNKRNNKVLSAFGESKNLSAWADDSRCVVSLMALTKRVQAGWSVEQAITKPARPYPRRSA